MPEYIDREAFKKSVEERYCKPCKAEGKDHNGCRCRACWVDDMLDEVDCFQPSDVVPVVHGCWIVYETISWIHANPKLRKYYRCSNCLTASAVRHKGCPNCFARMDADTQEREETK